MIQLYSVADHIKQQVSMLEVAEYYGFSTNRRTRKICCPFHNDTKPSMQLYSGSKGFYCFVCQTGGSVIDFVMRLFNLSFADACKKMNDDFRLGLSVDGELTEQQRREAAEARRKLLEERERRKAKEKQLRTAYQAACDRYSFLDMLMIQHAPKNPQAPVDEEYSYAVKRIDAAWSEVEEAEAKLSDFLKGSGQ